MSRQHVPYIDLCEVWRIFPADCVHEIHNPQKNLYKKHYKNTCSSTDDVVKTEPCDYLQVKVCHLCIILAQVLVQIRTRSGLQNKNTNWFTSDSELKVGLQLTASDLRSSYTLQFIIACISFSRTLQNGH